MSSKSADFLEQSIAIINRSAKDLKTVCLDESRYTLRDRFASTVAGAIYEQSVAASHEDDFELSQDSRPSSEVTQTYFAHYPSQDFRFQPDFSANQDNEATLWGWDENSYSGPSSHIVPEDSHEMA